MKRHARDAGVRVIVGSGVGKVLDTARAVAADLDLPVVNCPAVASSDAPCSALSVIYTDRGALLHYRIYAKNPDLVLVDTQVIAHSPPRLLVAGMGDALATWFEAKTCVEGNGKNTHGAAPPRARWTWQNSATASCLAMEWMRYLLCGASRQPRPWSVWWKPTRCYPVWVLNRRGWPRRMPSTMA